MPTPNTAIQCQHLTLHAHNNTNDNGGWKVTEEIISDVTVNCAGRNMFNTCPAAAWREYLLATLDVLKYLNTPKSIEILRKAFKYTPTSSRCVGVFINYASPFFITFFSLPS